MVFRHHEPAATRTARPADEAPPLCKMPLFQCVLRESDYRGHWDLLSAGAPASFLHRSPSIRWCTQNSAGGARSFRPDRSRTEVPPQPVQGHDNKQQQRGSHIPGDYRHPGHGVTSFPSKMNREYLNPSVVFSNVASVSHRPFQAMEVKADSTQVPVRRGIIAKRGRLGRNYRQAVTKFCVPTERHRAEWSALGTPKEPCDERIGHYS